MALNATTLIAAPTVDPAATDPTNIVAKNQLLKERDIVATPNYTAAGPTPIQGEIKTGTVDADKRFGTDATGRIFMINPGSLGGAGSGNGSGMGTSGMTPAPGSPGFNLQAPGIPDRPDTSEIDAQLKDLRGKMLTPEQIDQNLQADLNAINLRYADQETTLLSDMESEKQAAFSDLAGIGVGINPLSSAGTSIATAANVRKDRAVGNLRALQAAEIARSRAAAQGQKTEALDKQIASLEKERSLMKQDADEQYNKLRQHFDDTVKALNTSASLAREARDLTSSERADALKQVNNLFDLMGSKAFDGVDAGAIADLERASGMPVGSISMAKNKLKEDEARKQAADNRGELRTVGKSLFQVQYDEKGNAITRLVSGDGSGGGSSGGSSGSSGSSGGTTTPSGASLSYEDFLKAYSEEFQITPDPNSPTLRSLYVDALNDPTISGGGQQAEASGYTDKQVFKLLSSEDKKRMIATGLNPDNPTQAREYLGTAYKPKETKSGSSSSSSTPTSSSLF